MLRRRALWGREAIADRTRGRTTTLHQLSIALVSLFAAMVAVVMGSPGDLELLLAGLLLITVLTAAVIALPWQRLHPMWSLPLPLLDALAIGLMRESNPTVGFALLWIFPAIWLSGSFGLYGLVIANVFINGIYWYIAGTEHGGEVTPAVVLVPMMIGAVTVTSYISARRTAYQRILLAKQARQLKRSVEESRRHEDTLSEVLDSVDFGVIRFDAEGRETMRNEAHARMQRFPGEEEQRPALYAADGATELTEDTVPLARARRGEEFDRDLVWYGSRGSGRRALSVTSRSLWAPDGAPAGGILISLDVTDEIMAMHAREDLVASVSHELRTPLTSILGYLELVLDSEDLTPRTRRRIEIAERNATRLLTIVADILAVRADDEGGLQLPINPETKRIDDVIHAAVEGFRTSMQERHMSIDATAVEQVNAVIDPLRIRQVIDNLLGNAVKYGRDGGRIEVGATCDDDDAWIVVRDDGPGISAEELPHVFERFFRTDTVRRTSTHGSGLGLSIAREIVRGHGGEITAQSGMGEGATFVVRLPLNARERTSS